MERLNVTIDAFGGVILWTSDLERMAAFYRDILELPVHSVHTDFIAFQLGEVRFSIGLHSEVHGINREPHRIMVNFLASDIRSTHRLLATRGVEFVRPPEREHWGGWIATFRDPDGNLLQLLQPAT